MLYHVLAQKHEQIQNTTPKSIIKGEGLHLNFDTVVSGT